jgi:NADH-quinone oxidoreductase subunit M
MNLLAGYWLEATVLLPALGALVVSRLHPRDMGRGASVAVSGLTLLCALGAWQSFATSGDAELSAGGWARGLLSIDALSAPLLPWVALMYFVTFVATLDSRLRESSFTWTLASEAVVLATFACRAPWPLVAVLALGTLPPYLELRAAGRPTRIYVVHMALFVVLLLVGWRALDGLGLDSPLAPVALLLLVGAVLIRSGIAPFHCWVTDLFERATLGTALLCVAPMVGAYAALRLVVPVAPAWALEGMGLAALLMAVYASALALVQNELRRFFACLVLSLSSLVLLGMCLETTVGLTGALCLWLSVGLALCGFGLTVRALEARRGRLSLRSYQGLYEHTPNLAMCFGLTAFASIGFPGSFGFVGTELLVDGAVESHPYVGIAIVVAAAMSGIAVVRAYFRLFSGTHYFSTVSLKIGLRERYAVLGLAALILGFGLFPQPEVAARYRAAEGLLERRAVLVGGDRPTDELAAAATTGQ